MIFVCENNLYGLSTPVREAVSVDHISDRAMAYGIPGISIDGNDIIAVHTKMMEAVERARAGEGPTLLDCITYRFFGHFTGDPGKGITYRSKEEMGQWLERCPIKRFGERLLKEKRITEKMVKKMEANVTASIEEAVQFAQESPLPLPEEALQDLFH